MHQKWTTFMKWHNGRPMLSNHRVFSFWETTIKWHRLLISFPLQTLETEMLALRMYEYIYILNIHNNHKMTENNTFAEQIAKILALELRTQILNTCTYLLPLGPATYSMRSLDSCPCAWPMKATAGQMTSGRLTKARPRSWSRPCSLRALKLTIL